MPLILGDSPRMNLIVTSEPRKLAAICAEHSPAAERLPAELLERTLAGLGVDRCSEPTLETLRALYGAWCQRVPFDNVRKLLHVRSGCRGALPGSTAQDFLEAWLKFGTGGTCWSGAGAFHSLLAALGFDVLRGVATMLVKPDVPPNHGTVLVRLGRARYLVDCSMLHGEPLLLADDSDAVIPHPAWGLSGSRRDGRWHIRWRPLNRLDGFECRLEYFGATREEFRDYNERTRGWSPFNYEVTARINRRDSAVGVSFGRAVSLGGDGSVVSMEIDTRERNRRLIEDIGISEELVRALPEDVPTPPPPGSRTALLRTA